MIPDSARKDSIRVMFPMNLGHWQVSFVVNTRMACNAVESSVSLILSTKLLSSVFNHPDIEGVVL